MTHVTCRLTDKDRDLLRKPTLGDRVWATFIIVTIIIISISSTQADSASYPQWGQKMSTS